jgi:release factor glutamine methyltransferase
MQVPSDSQTLPLQVKHLFKKKGNAIAAYSQDLRPSPYTTALLRIIQEYCVNRKMPDVLDVGVGSGVLLAALSRLGAQGLWGVDINAEALVSADQLLAEVARDKEIHLFQGDMWNPIAPEKKFAVIVANLPHFPAYVSVPDRPKTWTGGEGRKMIDRFIEALPHRLTPDGIAFITHNDLVGLKHTTAFIASYGLEGETVAQWSVFEPPERIGAVSAHTIATGGETLQYFGGYAFVDARILAIKIKTGSTLAKVI